MNYESLLAFGLVAGVNIASVTSGDMSSGVGFASTAFAAIICILVSRTVAAFEL